MKKIPKRLKSAATLFKSKESLTVKNAVSLIKKYASSGFAAKFNETISMEVKLGIDGKRSDQIIRGSSTFPFPSGVKRKILAIGSFENQQKIEGVDIDFIDKSSLKEISSGSFNVKNYNLCIATESSMRDIASSGAAKTLGIRGIMPNIKYGTVFKNESIMIDNINDVSQKLIQIKSDKFGFAKIPVGKILSDESQIESNIEYAISCLNQLKPQSFSGNLIKSIRLSSSMMGSSVLIS